MTLVCEYDDGSPYYMSAIDKWTDPRDPAWRLKYYKSTVGMYDEVADWLDNNCEGGYDYVCRFNSGSPYMEIELLLETDVIAFKLRFS